MNSVVVPITEVVSQTATRARGKEAFAQLVQRIKTQEKHPVSIMVDFRNVALLTASFLDELVLRYTSMPQGARLIFWLDSEDNLNKLREVCAAREVRCLYQLGDDTTIKATRRKKLSNIEIHEYKGPFFDVVET